ncbi:MULTISPECIES: DUF2325 domain-containing protein [unclassified Exiguobacterium]|uniref:DUF2325 domain-containing protein n=1 Tax=unclassified Exiguobacterium TaxID=2644629 RepID=UPI001BE8CA97|nr:MULTISPECIES: DUF2325 domain-containing protein [unclassified Exiguobacterium]
MMHHVIERAKELVTSKLNIVETADDWGLLLEEINGIDEWVQLSQYYAPRQTTTKLVERPETPSSLPIKMIQERKEEVERTVEQRYSYTFERQLKGGSLREWPNSHVSETEIRDWNLEHGMEVRVQVLHQDERRTSLEILAVVATDQVKPLAERIVFEKCIVKNHGIIEATIDGPLQDETGKPFYYTTPLEDMRFFQLKAGQLVDLVMWKGHPETLTIVWKHAFHYEVPTMTELPARDVSNGSPESATASPANKQAKTGRYDKMMQRKPKAKKVKKERRLREKKVQQLERLDTTTLPGQPIEFVDKTALDFASYDGMRLVIVGNEQQRAVYRDFFAETGVELIHLGGDAQAAKKIACLAKKTDAIVVIKSRVSHAAAAHVLVQAKKHDIPFAIERLDGRSSLYTACQQQLEKAMVQRLLKDER